MATLKDRHNPSFLLYPVNDNRTAWRPFGLPAILVVPHRRFTNGDSIANSNVWGIRIYIEDVPQEAFVAGHDHVGQRFPDRELYAETVDSIELADRAIVPADHSFTSNGTAIDYTDATEGDTFEFTTTTGITDTIPYLPDADYYDLSDFVIEVETLPADRYNLVYQTEYFQRTISNDESLEFLCIDINHVGRAVLRLQINHPGDVIHEFYTHTPPPYLTNATRAQDTTVALYRPFTNILQDIMDEQDLLEQVNWVFDTPAEAIPYLSSLLGWDLPYFPESLDILRRAVLRRTVEFQNLAGSRRAIINLFRLFGFEILLSNLWWSSDGKRFIRPGERLPAPYEDEEITIQAACQVDLLLNDWETSGFGTFDIPFLFRPQEEAGLDNFTSLRDGGNITIEAYTVEKDSVAYTALQGIATAILADVENYGELGCSTDSNDFRSSTAISSVMDGLNVLGFSQVLITGKLGEATQEILVGTEPPISKANTSFNRETNRLQLTFNGHQDLTDKAIFAFAIYERQKLIVPDIISDLQSNRFDIQVLTQDFSEFADPVTLEFALEFLNRLKAFHSLLNAIRTTVELTETYEVTDWCIGGDRQQRYDTDAGRLQVPPAIIPDIPSDINDCTKLDPRTLGYKDEDILLRQRKLANLPEEHAAWKALDDRLDTAAEGLQLSPAPAAPGRDECRYTQYGQDRITTDARVELKSVINHPSPTAAQQGGIETNPRLSPIDTSDNGEFSGTGTLASSNSDSSAFSSFTREYTDIRVPLCDLTGVDYCYKGRVDDELLYRQTLVTDDYPRSRPCSIGMGVGVYYTYPSLSIMVVPGTVRPASGSKTSKSQFSGAAPAGGLQQYSTGIQNEYLNAPYDEPLDRKLNSVLGRLYREYDNPPDQTLHYSNRLGLPNPNQRYQLALQRPSLVIDKPTLHLPGCRFPLMNALLADFTHPDWEARPWDDAYSTYCGPINSCSSDPTFLNCQLVAGTGDNETMVFDSVPFTIVSNGLTPDIPSLGDHTLGTSAAFSELDVVHSVYMGGADDSIYVVLDQVCDYDSAVDDAILVVPEAVFNSHNECTTGETIDYADGYACVSGFQTYNGEDYSTYEEVLIGLGMTFFGTSVPSALFLLGSGIRVETGVRLDCGCLLTPCDGTTEGDTICGTSSYLDDDDTYDWNSDHLQIELRLIAEELVGTCSTQLNGEIPTLLEML